MSDVSGRIRHLTPSVQDNPSNVPSRFRRVARKTEKGFTAEGNRLANTKDLMPARKSASEQVPNNGVINGNDER
jgi:hypothetical protein